MKTNKLLIIAGIAIGIGAAIAGFAFALSHSMRRMHIFDSDPGEGFLDSIIPRL